MILGAQIHRLPRRRRTRAGARAFTLVEVILAIGIAVGLLVVALVFYQQAANLRGELIDQAEKISALRLIFDRISADLRTAFPQPHIGFSGTIDSMNLTIARAPELIPGGPNPVVGPASDLRRITYMLTAALEGTNFVITGLDRTEEPLLPRSSMAPSSSGSLLTDATTTASAGSTVAPGPTPRPGAASLAPSEPLADTVRFVRFRYWDGAAWLEAWDAPELPMAVEISLGLEPLPENELPEAYPYELFRRVVRLPGRASAEDDWWASL
jgi:hypothetical protein